MKKIISLFQRNYDGDRLVRDEVVPGAEWVLAGEGVATRKFDGTCCAVIDGKIHKRYDAKEGKQPPENFIPAQDPDPTTGHWPGWVPCGAEPDSKWHQEAFMANNYSDGTYELCGPKVQNNPEGFPSHVLVPHGVGIKAPTERLIRELQIAMQAALRSAPPSGPQESVSQQIDRTFGQRVEHVTGCTCDRCQREQAPFDKTNAGEERKDLAKVPAAAPHAEEISESGQREPFTAVSSPDTGEGGDNKCSELPHAETRKDTANLKLGPQDSPSRCLVGNRIYFDYWPRVAYELLLWAKETPDDDTSVQHLASMLEKKFDRKPAPPSPAREPKKQPATKYCDENNCCTVCGEGASGGNHSNCWIPNPLVKHKSPAREKEKAE